MLVVLCARDTVCWSFIQSGQNEKTAWCLNDNFKIAYEPSPSADWIRVLKAVNAHTVTLAGAVSNVLWVAM